MKGILMARLDIAIDTPAGFSALRRLDDRIAESLGRELFDLVKLRASQINGCGYCVDAHAAALEREGMDHRTLNGVAAWRHTRFFTEQQVVVLEFTEALTPHIGPVSDELWDRAGRLLGVQRRADLLLGVGVIGIWNVIGLAGEMVASADTTRT